MKIEIEFDNSYEASLKIDGYDMLVVSKSGMVQLKGITTHQMENTLGGIAAIELHPIISQIQQAWATADEEQPSCETWDVLEDRTLDAMIECF